MLKRVSQPKMDRFARAPERHDFWTGLVLVLIGLVVLLCGARHLTNIDTVEGNTAWESELVRAFANGGLEYVDPAAGSDPFSRNDPDLAVDTLEQRERQIASVGTGVFRVNTGAANPCPT